MFSSKGDLSRLHELVEATHGTPLPVGLFVPIEAAWQVVKEFIETDGELPKSIAWIGQSATLCCPLRTSRTQSETTILTMNGAGTASASQTKSLPR
jgi:Immunity protein Imm1